MTGIRTISRAEVRTAHQRLTAMWTRFGSYRMLCHRCMQPIDPQTAVWLELQISTAKYLRVDQRVTTEADSQGMFVFGPTCARNANRRFTGFGVCS